MFCGVVGSPYLVLVLVPVGWADTPKQGLLGLTLRVVRYAAHARVARLCVCVCVGQLTATSNHQCLGMWRD